MNKRILVIAFHYPPIQGSTGVHRTASMTRYLPELGWQPVVLTADTRAYPRIVSNPEADADNVYRAWGRDTAKSFAIRGWYPRLLTLPDRWQSWAVGGVRTGRKLIRQFRPDLIYSTYPIATAHLIGLHLHRTSGLPWIADFRDPMAQEDYPVDPLQRKAFFALEKRVVREANMCLLTTPGARDYYRDRYPDRAAKFALWENGYDEAAFAAAEQLPTGRSDKLVLLHSGLLYESERNPAHFFEAVAQLKKAGLLADVEIRLRASGNQAAYQRELERLAIDDRVLLKDAVPYHQALREMLDADGLLIFQAENCNQQIPAKIYEYFRARRPIFAMTHDDGDTARLLQTETGADIADLESTADIAVKLETFIADLRAGKSRVTAGTETEKYSREGRVRQLVQILEQVGGAV